MNYKFEAYTIVGVIILISGLLRLYIYYKAFNISILPFLEPDEIGTIFFDNLLYFLLFATLNIVIFASLYTSSGKIAADNLPFNFKARLMRYGITKLNKVIILIVLIAIAGLTFSISTRILFYEFILWMALIAIALFANPIAILEIKRIVHIKKLDINLLSIYFFIAAINLFIFAALSGMNEANKVKNHHYYSGTEFTIDNYGLFTSDEKNFYIGKTKQFVFFYDKDNKVTKVVPIGKITTMKYN